MTRANVKSVALLNFDSFIIKISLISEFKTAHILSDFNNTFESGNKFQSGLSMNLLKKIIV